VSRRLRPRLVPLRGAPRLGRLLALALVTSCKHDSELPSGHITVRNEGGAVTRELRATSYGYLLKPERVRVQVVEGTLDAGEVRYEKGMLLSGGNLRARVERKADAVALFDAARAPLGQIVERDGETWVYDPGGTPIGRAKTDKDRIVLVDRDGAAKGFVTGLPQQAAAAFLVGAGLSDVEKSMLALSLRQ